MTTTVLKRSDKRDLQNLHGQIHFIKSFNGRIGEIAETVPHEVHWLNSIEAICEAVANARSEWALFDRAYYKESDGSCRLIDPARVVSRIDQLIRRDFEGAMAAQSGRLLHIHLEPERSIDTDRYELVVGPDSAAVCLIEP